MRKMWVSVISLMIGTLLAGCEAALVKPEDIIREALEGEEQPVAYEAETFHDEGFTEKILVNTNGDMRQDFYMGSIPTQSHIYRGDTMYELDYEGKTIIEKESDGSNTKHLPLKRLTTTIDQLADTHTMEVTNGEKYLERDVHHLIFEPKEEGDMRAEYWVDKETFIILREVIENEFEAYEMTTKFLRLDVNVTDSDFELGDTSGLEQLVAKEYIPLEEIPDFFDQPVWLPDHELNNWEIVGTFIKYKGVGSEDSVVVNYVDDGDREFVFEVDRNLHRVQWEPEIYSEETARDVMIRMSWEPSAHQAVWIENDLRYDLFTQQDWARDDAIRVIESMTVLEVESD
ncbi:LolA family protein [Shouchella lonarensis]|uniref:Outer membrane lipoprotein-sorting protein n=1 Tax=Shouchella lonarensis TaxID=1464122 RepID=A0A1G6J0I6_9BACI|nr:hypothetical protein [Shouchella lonarensis]SDC11805.1 hypothetical protein SAMN05421737_105208 [Shouchella lonarensis]